jgi:hypothetical protein
MPSNVSGSSWCAHRHDCRESRFFCTRQRLLTESVFCHISNKETTHGDFPCCIPGTLVYLEDAQPHEVRTLEDASLLITMLLHRD